MKTQKARLQRINTIKSLAMVSMIGSCAYLALKDKDIGTVPVVAKVTHEYVTNLDKASGYIAAIKDACGQPCDAVALVR